MLLAIYSLGHWPIFFYICELCYKNGYNKSKIAAFLLSLEKDCALDVLKRNNVKCIGDGTQVIMFAHGFGLRPGNVEIYLPPLFIAN